LEYLTEAIRINQGTKRKRGGGVLQKTKARHLRKLVKESQYHVFGKSPEALVN